MRKFEIRFFALGTSVNLEGTRMLLYKYIFFVNSAVVQTTARFVEFPFHLNIQHAISAKKGKHIDHINLMCSEYYDLHII